MKCYRWQTKVRGENPENIKNNDRQVNSFVTASKSRMVTVYEVNNKTSVKDLIDSILKKHSIKYVYDDEQHEFIVYGYK